MNVAHYASKVKYDAHSHVLLVLVIAKLQKVPKENKWLPGKKRLGSHSVLWYNLSAKKSFRYPVIYFCENGDKIDLQVSYNIRMIFLKKGLD